MKRRRNELNEILPEGYVSKRPCHYKEDEKIILSQERHTHFNCVSFSPTAKDKPLSPTTEIHPFISSMELSKSSLMALTDSILSFIFFSSSLFDSYFLITTISLINKRLYHLSRRMIKCLDLHHTKNLHMLLTKCVIHRYRNLESLDLKWCNYVLPETLAIVAESFPNLHLLNLRRINSKTTTVTSSIQNKTRISLGSLLSPTPYSTNTAISLADSGCYLKSFKKLSILDLSCNSTITDETILHISSIQSLQRLYVALCHQLTNQALVALENLTCLTHLDISCCVKINSLLPLCSQKSLRYLDVSGLREISNHTFEALIKNSPKLEFLSIAYCTQLTNEVWQYLATLQHLNTLHIRGLINLTRMLPLELRTALAQVIPRLQTIDMSSCALDVNLTKRFRDMNPSMKIVGEVLYNTPVPSLQPPIVPLLGPNTSLRKATRNNTIALDLPAGNADDPLHEHRHMSRMQNVLHHMGSFQSDRQEEGS